MMLLTSLLPLGGRAPVLRGQGPNLERCEFGTRSPGGHCPHLPVAVTRWRGRRMVSGSPLLVATVCRYGMRSVGNSWSHCQTGEGQLRGRRMVSGSLCMLVMVIALTWG